MQKQIKKSSLFLKRSNTFFTSCHTTTGFVKQLEKDALLWYQNNESYKTR